MVKGYDVNQIKEDFKKVIKYSQGIEDPKVDNLFKLWEKSKEKFINRFDGLIWEWPVEINFHLGEKEKETKVKQFAEEVHSIYHNPDLACFIDNNVLSFFDNKITSDSNSSNKIPKDMKLIKAFKYFENDKKVLRKIQDAASQLIQENKIKGKLCFSVHPLDFLSSSENTYNWRTCHSLDGEFRSGNLSYMLDKTTFIVYLKGEDNVNLHAFGPDVKWNSKKWRVLFHEHPEGHILFAGRQYPFASKEGLDIALNVYNNIIAEEEYRNSCNIHVPYKTYKPWHNDYINCVCTENNLAPIELDYDYIVYDKKLIELINVVETGLYSLNYNDILNSSVYNSPYYTTAGYEIIDKIKDSPITIGEEVTCLRCGYERIDDPQTMVCDECLEEMSGGAIFKGYCNCCGRGIYEDEIHYPAHDVGFICESCFEDYCFVCDDCKTIHYREEMNYVSDGEKQVCDSCFDLFYSEEKK